LVIEALEVYRLLLRRLYGGVGVVFF